VREIAAGAPERGDRVTVVVLDVDDEENGALGRG